MNKLEDFFIAPIHAGVINITEVTEDDIDIRDIARNLSILYRYNGATCRPYSVAEHSLLLSEVVPEDLARVALIHDATEAYLGDLPYPLKKNCPYFSTLESRLSEVIYSKFKCYPPPSFWEYDNRIRANEALCLFKHLNNEDRNKWYNIIVTQGNPLPNVVIDHEENHTPEYMYKLYMERFFDLFPWYEF